MEHLACSQSPLSYNDFDAFYVFSDLKVLLFMAKIIKNIVAEPL